jgi:hypothetical protein
MKSRNKYLSQAVTDGFSARSGKPNLKSSNGAVRFAAAWGRVLRRGTALASRVVLRRDWRLNRATLSSRILGSRILTQDATTYRDAVVRQFAVMTVVWGIVGMTVGVLIAAQLLWPDIT